MATSTNSDGPFAPRALTPLARALLVIAGVIFVAAGVAAAATLAAFLVVQPEGISRLSFTGREFAYGAVWLIFSIALLVAGTSMATGAIRGARRDLVRGPTLYILGTCLGVIGLFLLTAHQVVSAGLAIVAGLVLIIVEYRSELI